MTHDNTDATRRARYRARDWLRRHSSTTAARCGWAPTGAAVTVHETPDGRRHATGVVSCGLTWLCPVCSARIQAVRARILGESLRRHVHSGGQIVMWTATLRHHRGTLLAHLWDQVSRSWHAAASGAAWRQACERLGTPYPGRMGRVESRIPYVRTVEVTVGEESGWHPHVHVLLYLPTHATDADIRDLCDGMHARWIRAARRAGHDAAPAGQHWTVVHGSRIDRALAAYLGKQVLGAGAEVVLGAQKKGRRGRYTPMQILRALADGRQEPRLLRWWREYEEASQRRRQLVPAPGWLAHQGLGCTLDEAGELAASSWADEGESAAEAETRPVAVIGRDLVIATAARGRWWRVLVDGQDLRDLRPAWIRTCTTAQLGVELGRWDSGRGCLLVLE